MTAAQAQAQNQDVQRQTSVFMTKAGPVPVFFNPYRQVAACSVPHNLHIHKEKISFDKILNVQPQVQIVPTIDKVQGESYPVISSVKGMTFGLVDLTEAPEILGALKPSEAPEIKLDDGWSPSYVGCLYYKRKEELAQEGEPTIHAIQARMIAYGVEDPGTGSACGALACYLALNRDIRNQEPTPVKKEEDAEKDLVSKTEKVKLEDKTASPKLERHVYAVQQGLEMGRLCTIAVEVDLKTEDDGSKKVANVTLSGRANFFLKGEIIGS